LTQNKNTVVQVLGNVPEMGKKKQPKIPDDSWRVFNEIVLLLGPILHATNQIQKDKVSEVQSQCLKTAKPYHRR
jgi:hypothetical protein